MINIIEAMRLLKDYNIISFLIFAWLILSCHCYAGAPLRVAVSILPQKYFVEKIGGERVDVVAMIPAGASPVTFEPKASKLRSLKGCKIYFSIGVPFEKAWINKFLKISRDMEIVRTYEGIERRIRGRSDPHIWLSPPLVFQQTRNILRALIDKDPLSTSFYIKNYREFIEEIGSLDSQLLEIFKGIGKRNHFVVYHPAWTHFARAYNLEQIPIEREGKEPSLSQLRQVFKLLRWLNIDTIFYQIQFPSRTINILAKELVCKAIPLDPLAYGWKEELLRSAKLIKTALR